MQPKHQMRENKCSTSKRKRNEQYMHNEAEIKSNHVILSHQKAGITKIPREMEGKTPPILTESTYHSGGILVSSKKKSVIKNDPIFTILI
jgi:hypothetical protein